ncbi:MAG: hypothetical protein M0P58_08850 [Bacteroidales bacterium]|jgi:PAS domain-containing protein|nr:hypothetical protein [Bacteroidales bacterium]
MKKKELALSDTQMLRIKAEEKLKIKQKQIDKELMEPDTKRLLHELQVHQIELEMQNEELHRAAELAETALKRYTLLYDFAPVGFLTLDRNGMIGELNFTAAELLGDKRFSLVNTRFKLFVPEESKLVFDDFFQKVYTSNAKESCKIMLGHDNKSPRFVYMEGIVIADDQTCLLSVVDTSGFMK